MRRILGKMKGLRNCFFKRYLYILGRDSFSDLSEVQVGDLTMAMTFIAPGLLPNP